MWKCRSRPQQIWYNVLGLYGSPLAFCVSNTKQHSQNCISERVSMPNSALNGFSPGENLLFRLSAHCSHTLTVRSVCNLVFWGIPLTITLATSLSDFGKPYTQLADVRCTQASRLLVQAADVGMVGNGGFVLAGSLGEHRESRPAASASTSTFSTVVLISGKSLNISKSMSTRKSAVCCVDSAKLAVRSQLASHSFSHPSSIAKDAIASTGKTHSTCPSTYGGDHPACYLLAPAAFSKTRRPHKLVTKLFWEGSFPQVPQVLQIA